MARRFAKGSEEEIVAINEAAFLILKQVSPQFKRRTFHMPNLIPLIKYMKRSTFESIKFNMCNLGRPKN